VRDDGTAICAGVPGVLPDNRVIAGLGFHPSPLRELTQRAKFIRGIISGLDREGVAIIREIASQPELEQLLLVVALYGGSRTWDDVLFDLLGLQDSSPNRISSRVLARRIGPDRPANLLWVQPRGGGYGHVVIGNVGNLLVDARWDATDAILSLPLEPAAADALRRWIDNLHARSRALTVENAAAPRLRLPEGDVEGERLWRQYLELLDAAEEGRRAEIVVESETDEVTSGSGPTPSEALLDANKEGRRAEIVVDSETGEVTSGSGPTPSEANTFPRPDPVLLAVQTVLAKGSVIALDRSSRAPPLDTPVKAELFGEAAETRSGAARRQQRFSVSLFDEDTSRRLGNRRTAMADRLASCSLMLRDGVRWVPDAADELLNAEFAAVEQEAAAALKTAIGGKDAEDFVTATLSKIADDCGALAALIAPGRKSPASLVENIKADLTERLKKNLKQGMVPGINRSRYQISAAESAREGPWDQVQTFLGSAARFPRELFADVRRMFGMVSRAEALVAAFNVFDDPLVARYLEGRRVEQQARSELELIKSIQEHEAAKPKQRAHALFRLLKGKAHEEVKAALTDPSIAE
jgi:hypothetical protein